MLIALTEVLCIIIQRVLLKKDSIRLEFKTKTGLSGGIQKWKIELYLNSFRR